MQTESKNKYTLIGDICFIFKTVWNFDWRRVVLGILNSATVYLLEIYTSIIFFRYVFDSISDEANYYKIITFVGASLLLYMVINLYQLWYTKRFEPISDSAMYRNLAQLVFEKAVDVELACYDDADFYNKYTMAMADTEKRIKSVMDNTYSIVGSTIEAIIVYITLFSIDKWASLVGFFPIIANFVFAYFYNKLVFERYKENMPWFRERDYVNRVVYLKNYSNEFRMTNGYKIIRDTYFRAHENIFAVLKKYRRKLVFYHFSDMVFSFFFVLQGLLFYGAYRAMVTKSISISDFAVFSSIMTNATFSIRKISESLTQVINAGMYIDNFRSFLVYKNKLVESKSPVIPSEDIKSLEFRNVTFTYLGQKKPVIKNLSFIINKGEKVVFAGHNGAGKSTIIKLLMRLYDPDEGQILVNGIDIKEYDLDAYRNLFGVAFQDYQILAMTVAENVLMRHKNDADTEKIVSALKASGVYDKICQLEGNIDAMLTNEFDDDGNVLSGGEYQKVAIARAFAKKSSIAVFDEPSSALDAISENNLYQNMKEYAKDKMVLYISHRLGLAVEADRVILFENGQVCESGQHSDLMQQDGKYADLFRKQAMNYVDEQGEVM
ncbi:MAG: ABC transporter ATP-binding protein [Coprococcus sp.]|nr:ABC transporter ATP-binding protein [Coprococcus sp.]